MAEPSVKTRQWLHPRSETCWLYQSVILIFFNYRIIFTRPWCKSKVWHINVASCQPQDSYIFLYLTVQNWLGLTCLTVLEFASQDNALCSVRVFLLLLGHSLNSQSSFVSDIAHPCLTGLALLHFMVVWHSPLAVSYSPQIKFNKSHFNVWRFGLNPWKRYFEHRP